MNSPKTRAALAYLHTIASLIGTVDHSQGNGANAAKLRGDKLNDLRDIALEGIAKVEAAAELTPAQKAAPQLLDALEYGLELSDENGAIDSELDAESIAARFRSMRAAIAAATPQA